ncbi:hypothetical protein [Clostridium perfringens]|uniref:hypothetical protein n=1 Tax=Clostridium perfringens TaxID=1502 RepID=UPI0024BC6E06|nr:hypothetical protein [Clostridium perfringens]
MGYIIILLSPILGLIFLEIYVFLTSFMPWMSADGFVTSTSVMFAILGLIIVLNDKEKTK